MAETAVSELRAFSLAERSSYQMNIFSVYKSFTEIYIDRTIRGSIKMQCSDIKSEVAYKVEKEILWKGKTYLQLQSKCI